MRHLPARYCGLLWGEHQESHSSQRWKHEFSKQPGPNWRGNLYAQLRIYPGSSPPTQGRQKSTLNQEWEWQKNAKKLKNRRWFVDSRHWQRLNTRRNKQLTAPHIHLVELNLKQPVQRQQGHFRQWGRLKRAGHIACSREFNVLVPIRPSNKAGRFIACNRETATPTPWPSQTQI